jgi:predicted alpha-1,6-mannanase (GH76 family)/acetyl esterase/lipase
MMKQNKIAPVFALTFLGALGFSSVNAQNNSRLPLPAPLAVPVPGPSTNTPYAPQPILPGGVVVPLYAAGSPFLKMERIREAEKYNMRESVPGRIESIVNIHNPSIEVHTADPNRNTGAAVILMAGGGHTTLNVGPEGADFVPFFYNYGVNTIILRNRLRVDGYDVQKDEVNDALQSIRLVRSYAKEWNIDPKKIGIMGFSAGGELAAPAAVFFDDFDKKNSSQGDPLAGITSRPDFVCLVYPGGTPFSRNRTPPPIPRNVPPTFVVSAGSGDRGHAISSVAYFNAMLEIGVPNIEMHIYGNGRHAGGLSDRNDIPFGTWQYRYIDWFRDLGFLQKPGMETKAARDIAAFLAEPATSTSNPRAARSPGEPKPAMEFSLNSAAGLKTLQTWYTEDTGLWKTTGWWNAANALTVLVEYSKISNTSDLLPVIANTFERNSEKHFLNKYYDDEGWWALGWADAYELSHQARYLEMAEQIFTDMTAGWDDTCSGGIWWSKDRHYKNAIANELFLSIAARLANLSQDEQKRATYLDWAQREWKWFATSGMINKDNLVNDGLDSTCHNNQRTVWTYNQGVILGGLSALTKASNDVKALSVARSIALAAISRLTDPEGVLHDPCEPSRCGKDAVQFKGIFARNLAALNAEARAPQFAAFLETNAEAVWKNRDSDNRFGVVWSGLSDVKNAATQVSGLDALLAAAQSGSAVPIK